MIDFINVEKTYKSGVEALRGVNFTIEDGEFVFVIGKSGSGKSTLLKCITCEETPTSGKVTIDNFDISHMSRALVPVLRRRIGMIYQDFRLIETKTVAENVAFAGEIIGVPRQSLNNTVQICLSVVGLKDKADCYPQELSGGEQQRVAIARAMVNNPSLIVADEPTGNLDPETSEAIMAMLLEINRNGGTTVIICTHDSAMVDRMKQRVIEIEDGLIARDEKKSSYKGDAAEQAPGVPEPIRTPEYKGSSVAFGDDEEYSDNYDDSGYIASQISGPESSLVFGEDKSGAGKPAAPAATDAGMFFETEPAEEDTADDTEPASSFEDLTQAVEVVETDNAVISVEEEPKTEAEPEVSDEPGVMPEADRAQVTSITNDEGSFISFGDEQPKAESPVVSKAASEDADPDITSDSDLEFPDEEADDPRDIRREQKRRMREEKAAAKEAKRREKLDKKKKARRTDFKPGSDIDLFPEDDE